MPLQPDSAGGPKWDPEMLREVVAEWGLLETLLHEVDWSAANLTEEQGSGLTAGQDWRAAWESLYGQITRRFPHLVHDATSLGFHLAGAVTRYVALMIETRELGDPAIVRMPPRRALVPVGDREVSAAGLTDLAATIAQVREQLGELHQRIRFGDDGGAGVREPRRPYPPQDAGTLTLPEEV